MDHCFCSPATGIAVGGRRSVAERVTSSASDLNLPRSRAHVWQALPRTVVPAVATLAEAHDSPLGRKGQADLAAHSARGRPLRDGERPPSLRGTLHRGARLRDQEAAWNAPLSEARAAYKQMGMPKQVEMADQVLSGRTPPPG